MKSFYVKGLEGLCDDWGCSEPFTAYDVIRRRLDAGEQLSEEDIEEIARRFNCRIVWGECLCD